MTSATENTETEKSALKAKEWVKSALGKKRIGEILQIAKRAEARLAIARKVDPKSLKKPITR